MDGRVVTFYSYKGGVGRTMAMANIGALLSTWNRKILCIDWDLEAPGLSTYFRNWIKDTDRPGLVEWVQAHADGLESDWRDYLTEVRFPNCEQPLLLLSAGRQDESYVKRMQSLNWEQLYREHALGLFLEQARKEWIAEFDLILIDSRTGVTDTSGICTIHMPDILVAVMTPNEQNLQGCLQTIRRASAKREQLPFDREQISIMPVLSRFEMRVEYEQAQDWLVRFQEALNPLIKMWSYRGVETLDILYHLRIPYIPYWSFGERLPVIERGTDDPDDIGYALETMAALLRKQLEDNDILINDRDMYISLAKNQKIDHEYKLKEALIIKKISNEMENPNSIYVLLISRSIFHDEKTDNLKNFFKTFKLDEKEILEIINKFKQETITFPPYVKARLEALREAVQSGSDESAA